MIGAPCCDIAPAICWPDLRGAFVLPAPMLPLPTTAILRWIVNWDNAEPTGKVARCLIESAGPMLRFTTGFAALRSIQQTMIKELGLRTCHGASNRLTATGVLSPDGEWRHPMRALSYITALVFVLTGPSLAGSAGRDMPGVGTFTYCGSPVVTVEPDLTAVDSE